MTNRNYRMAPPSCWNGIFFWMLWVIAQHLVLTGSSFPSRENRGNYNILFICFVTSSALRCDQSSSTCFSSLSLHVFRTQFIYTSRTMVDTLSRKKEIQLCSIRGLNSVKQNFLSSSCPSRKSISVDTAPSAGSWNLQQPNIFAFSSSCLWPVLLV